MSIYAVVTQSVVSKTETTITMEWSSDNPVDYIWYSTDGGVTFATPNLISKDLRSGKYMIDKKSDDGLPLDAYTSYSIITRVRNFYTEALSNSAKMNVETYNYPYCKESPNFTIGDAIPLSFYNPLGRTCTVYLELADGTVMLWLSKMTGTGSSASPSSSAQNVLYKSIPNAKSGTYKVRVVYGDITRTRDNGNTYKIKGTETPTVGTISYADTNTTVTAITGNNQQIVQNQSNLKVTYTKATANNSATIVKYTFELNGVTKTSTSEGGTIDFGKVNSARNLTLTMTVTDSRGLTAKAKITITMLAHSTPTAKVTLERLNNYEDETYLTVNGSVSSVDGKNTMAIRYKYKESGGSYNSSVGISGNKKYTLSLDKEKSFIFSVSVTDAFGAKFEKEYVLDKGAFPLFIDTSLNSIGINCFPTEPMSLQINGKILGIQNRLLWSGEKYMLDTQTIELAEPISKQLSGIALVFSYYDGTAHDHNFNTFFISKGEVAELGGCGHSFAMFRSATEPFTEASVKYLYISDASIKGHYKNNYKGTGGCGITYDNTRYVLRYVFGV